MAHLTVDPRNPTTPRDSYGALSNGPTEAANSLIKRIKRGGFGFTNFRNYRVRVLLYAGRPNWALLPTITPR